MHVKCMKGILFFNPSSMRPAGTTSKPKPHLQLQQHEIHCPHAPETVPFPSPWWSKLPQQVFCQTTLFLLCNHALECFELAVPPVTNYPPPNTTVCTQLSTNIPNHHRVLDETIANALNVFFFCLIDVSHLGLLSIHETQEDWTTLRVCCLCHPHWRRAIKKPL